MLIGAIVLGLLLGLAAGGSIWNLGAVRLERVGLLFGAVVVRFGTEAAITAGVQAADALRLPLFGLAYAMLLAGLWWNRAHPGMSLAFVGILGNAIAIVVNGGQMPIWLPSLEASGLQEAEVRAAFHTILDADLDAHFLLHAGPLGDVIPIPFPFVRNVASIGDLFLSLGLAFFLFSTVVRSRQELAEEELEAIRRRVAGLRGGDPAGPGSAEGSYRGATTLAPGLAEAAVLDRPLVLGASAAGLAAPSAPAFPADVGVPAPVRGPAADVPAPEDVPADTVVAPPLHVPPPGDIAAPVDLEGTAVVDGPAAVDAPAEPGVRTPVASREVAAASGASAGAAATSVGSTGLAAAPAPAETPLTLAARRHPYVRLALNPSFSALWAGQMISLFGDRIHQVALAFLVLNATDSALATAGVFIAATLPNLFFSPIAGTFVDRWDHREVLVVSDLLRASLVLIVPVVAILNIYLVYPVIFLVTTISIFFRPARVAILPRIVRDDELLPANSALWIGETMADVIGYPLAGLFVAFLGSALPLAFWIDGATYVASAALLWTIAVPPLQRGVAHEEAAPREGFLAEMAMGWAFLRRDTTLLANTLQAAIGQLALGILIALTAVYARDVILTPTFSPESVYAFLETGIGVGNLVGGLVVGFVGGRFAKGRMIVLGYALFGTCITAVGLTDQLVLALGLMVGMGIANMVFVIPSQTLFQERTPTELIGRVVGFRFALVFGSMTLAMGAGGVLGELFGPAPVISAFGVVTLAVAIAGLLVPAVREA